MTNDSAAQALVTGWRNEAKAKRKRANELGDCRAGLELFTEATVLDACADQAEKALASRPASRAVVTLSRPEGYGHLPAPDRGAALTMAGVLFHYVGGSTELRERLARWLEHHEGDLDEQVILWYLTECHALLEPGCPEPMDWDAHPGRQR